MRQFHIGDILSVTTGYLVSPAPGLNGVWPLLDYMTGEALFNHVLPRAMKVCAPAILAQHPDLADADCTGVTPENVTERIAALVERYGEYREIAPLGADTFERRDPLAELVAMTDKPIIVAVTD